MTIVLLVLGCILACVILYKISTTHKFETFTLTCKKCGIFTRGLKCSMCENKKVN